MFNRRRLFGFLPLATFSGLRSTASPAVSSSTKHYITSASLRLKSPDLADRFEVVFPEGCFATQENIQKLVSSGFSCFELKNSFIPIDGHFTTENSVQWYKKGQLHRLDGPALILANGTQYWLQEGQFHRENGPAIIRSNGTQEWYKKGQLYCFDGPAIIYGDGLEVWYKNGVIYTPEP